VDIFACTHTCLPFAQRFPGAGRGRGKKKRTAGQGGGGEGGEGEGGVTLWGEQAGAISYTLDGHNDGIIFNNGSAGMANFEGKKWGLVTRISSGMRSYAKSV
jgi:hypothetical protein